MQKGQREQRYGLLRKVHNHTLPPNQANKMVLVEG